MKKTYKVILLIESSRASGRNYLQGVARYAHHHGPWSFYWEPGGLEAGRVKLKKLDADGIIFRDVARLTKEVLQLGIPAVIVGHTGHEVRGMRRGRSPSVPRMSSRAAPRTSWRWP